MTKNKKRNKLVHRTQFIPIACSGLALGMCGLSTLLDVSFQKFGWYQSNIWIVSSILLILIVPLLIIITIKYISHPKILQFELKEPLLCSFLPTYCMALMGISGYIAGWDNIGVTANQIIAAIIMCVALLLQFIIVGYFIRYVLMRHKWNEHPFYGSWFVPSVGMCTACTYTPRFSQLVLPDQFFQAIWFFGFVTYVLLLLPATYAILFKTKPDSSKLLSIAVFFAPANLTLASFINTFSVNIVAHSIYSISFIKSFSIFLWIFGTVIYVILLVVIFYLLKKTKFSYMYAAITFPMAIGAVAQLFCSTYFNNHIHDLVLISFVLFCIYGILSLGMISYIVVRFFILLFNDLIKSHNDNKYHVVYQNNEQNNDKEKVTHVA